MKALWVVAVVCAASFAAQGCRNHKRQPVPGPQVRAGGISSAMVGSMSRQQTHAAGAWQDQKAVRDAHSRTDAALRHGAVGIAWFQGNVEEAFSRADLPRSEAPNASRCTGHKRSPMT